jgi:hypothetical protein
MNLLTGKFVATEILWIAHAFLSILVDLPVIGQFGNS